MKKCVLVFVLIPCVYVHVGVAVCVCVGPVSVNEQEILAGGQYQQKDPCDLRKLKN